MMSHGGRASGGISIMKEKNKVSGELTLEKVLSVAPKEIKK